MHILANAVSYSEVEMRHMIGRQNLLREAFYFDAGYSIVAGLLLVAVLTTSFLVKGVGALLAQSNVLAEIAFMQWSSIFNILILLPLHVCKTNASSW